MTPEQEHKYTPGDLIEKGRSISKPLREEAVAEETDDTMHDLLVRAALAVDLVFEEAASRIRQEEIWKEIHARNNE